MAFTAVAFYWLTLPFYFATFKGGVGEGERSKEYANTQRTREQEEKVIL